MNRESRFWATAKWLAAMAAGAAGVCVSYTGFAWWRYGRSRRPREIDPLLDKFLPEYEVLERHRSRVRAPQEVTFEAAWKLNLHQSKIVRAIFRARELFLGSNQTGSANPLGLLDQAKAWGWGLLGEDPGHEFIFGGVTQPWLANPVFKALAPAEFVAFHTPGYVKIVWMIRADSIGPKKSIAITETRAAATDPVARAKFRRYWAFVSPGAILIRRMALHLVKQEAERLARASLPISVPQKT
jgi:hypothetical protein